MPVLFRDGGLFFMPGELAIFKPDEQHKGELCTVNNFIKDENNVLSAYQITLKKDGISTTCAVDEIFPLPKK